MSIDGAVTSRTGRAGEAPISLDRSVAELDVLTVRGARVAHRRDRLSGEEPLQIRAHGPGQAPVDIAVTMRTPGHEDELAIGFLLTEGLVSPAIAPLARFHLGDPIRMAQPHDEIVVEVSGPISALEPRRFLASASCGICGKASIDDVARRCDPLPSGPLIRGPLITALPPRMRSEQALFSRTGGLHAAALFTDDGLLVRVREDIGRHNAVDKVVGRAALESEWPLNRRILLVSGRISFEIVQKAAVAGIPILAGISAPSDLAVLTAQRLGMTLIGFLRDDGFNAYSGIDRLDLLDTAP